MKKELDSAHHYPYYKYNLSEDKMSYEFLTDNKIRYQIAFDDISDKGIEGMYIFSLIKLDDEKYFDERIKHTVIEIFKNFFSSNKYSVFYLCDIGDKKEKARYRLFHKWFLSDNFHQGLIKLDEQICVDEQFYYMSVIYGKDNPNAESIELFYTLNINQLKEK